MIESGPAVGWDRLVGRVREFVARRVAAHDVDDVVQEAILRVYRGLGRLRDDDRFGPWVYRVTRSAIADHLRARSRRVEKTQAIGDGLEEPIAEAPDDLQPALLACLSAFVAELPSPFREAITLTELEGVSQREAAEMLGLSVSGMKSRVQRGRGRLRAMFERCCEVRSLDARGRVVECEPRSGCAPGRARDASEADAPTS